MTVIHAGLEVPPMEPTRKDSHRDRDRERQSQFGGLSKKSNSTSQLSATGKIIKPEKTTRSKIPTLNSSVSSSSIVSIDR